MNKVEILPVRGGESPSDATQTAAKRPVFLLDSPKVQAQHRDRLAVVYIRQSTPQQLVVNRESLDRQYSLTNHALALGWASDRLLVIDEDLGLSGRSAENRPGFQHLLAEVALDHVGIVLALEMSRLARSNKDWHHLLEVCGIFGTLLADQDGVYDPQDPNDRLLLGLRGSISEAELHTMRNRLQRGMLNKAERGELFLHVPVGYVKSPAGGIELDPDEQVRAVVHLVLDKFDELGSGHAVTRYLLRHNIRIGIRPIEGPNRGQLEWRRPLSGLVFSILKHPFYAGTYAHGRCPVDPKRTRAGKGRKYVPMDQWKVIRHDCVPAYITWDRYLANQQRLKENRTRKEAKGVARQGSALLAGLIFCGRCGRRLNVGYDRKGHPRYDCVGYLQRNLEKTCCGVSGRPIDTLVTQQVLRALEPARLDLSLQAANNIQNERDRLTKHWKKELERARYEAQQAERCYRAVDPENRLVARTLEQRWEEALRQLRQREEDFERFQRETPLRLTEAEHQAIRSLASGLPALWQAPGTTAIDRKEIVRCLLERVVINVRGNTEHVDVTLHWAGGFVSQHALRRPVMRYRQLEHYDHLLERIRSLRGEGCTARQIALKLDQEGFHPPNRSAEFCKNIVLSLLAELGLTQARRTREQLEADEWWFRDLARELAIPGGRLRHWVYQGYVHYRKAAGRYWVLWADQDELERLRRLRDYLQTEHRIPYPRELTLPKERKSVETGKARAAAKKTTN